MLRLGPHCAFLTQSWQRFTAPVSLPRFTSQMFLCSEAKTNTNRSFLVRPQPHLSLSFFSLHYSLPQLHGSQMRILLRYFHYNIYRSTLLRGLSSVRSNANGTHTAKKYTKTIVSPPPEQSQVCDLSERQGNSVILSHLHYVLPGVL